MLHRIPASDKFATDALDAFDIPASKNKLRDVTQARMIGLIRQIGALSSHASAIFDKMMTSVGQVSSRIKNVSKGLLDTRAAMAAMDQSTTRISPNNTAAKTPIFEDTKIQTSNLFTKQTRPAHLRELYDDCQPPPDVTKLTPFAPKGVNLQARYSDPMFFFRSWAQGKQAMMDAIKMESQTVPKTKPAGFVVATTKQTKVKRAPTKPVQTEVFGPLASSPRTHVVAASEPPTTPATMATTPPPMATTPTPMATTPTPMATTPTPMTTNPPPMPATPPAMATTPPAMVTEKINHPITTSPIANHTSSEVPEMMSPQKQAPTSTSSDPFITPIATTNSMPPLPPPPSSMPPPPPPPAPASRNLKKRLQKFRKRKRKTNNKPPRRRRRKDQPFDITTQLQSHIQAQRKKNKAKKVHVNENGYTVIVTTDKKRPAEIHNQQDHVRNILTTMREMMYPESDEEESDEEWDL